MLAVVVVTREPPHLEATQLAMVVPSVPSIASCVFLPKVSNDVMSCCSLLAF